MDYWHRTGLIDSAAASAGSMSPASMAGLIHGITSQKGFMRPVRGAEASEEGLMIGPWGFAPELSSLSQDIEC
jgi:hypothetical protein